MLNLNVEEAVQEWEKSHGPIIPGKVRKVVRNLAEINITERRGFTRDDIHFKSKKDDKRAIIYRLKNRGIILPLPERRGRLSQYVLSNLFDYIAPTKLDDQDYEKENSLPNGLIDQIVSYFSRSDLGIHNIHIKIPARDADFIETYNYLKWNIDPKNKGKSKEFMIESRRNFTVIVYPGGTVLVNINCSSRPFKLCNASGLIDFFSSLGQIRSMLIGEFQNSISAIPSTYEWLLTQYDIDSAVSTTKLKQNPRVNISSSLRNSIQIKMFGHLFYCYLKNMPNMGEVYRFEERKWPDEKTIAEETTEILNSPPPIVRAIDLLNNGDSNNKT